MAGNAAAKSGRHAIIERRTSESSVRVDLLVDGSGRVDIETGIGFYDHMLSQLGRHGGFDLTVRTEGDLHVDSHHTVEDTALAVGSALSDALGDKGGVRRFGSVLVPLDEVLVQAAVDLSGRPYVVYEEPPGLPPFVGGSGPLFPTSLARHFWESFGTAARITVHVVVLRAARAGFQPDAHHVIEAQFKAVARALRDAVRIDGPAGAIPSTKGVL